ncbi:MAG TPA: hypothetical protein VFQ61_29305 [Polyangiaceae bacterium]|nr:hypothetical protein [Polyangiaceae bacterium]
MTETPQGTERVIDGTRRVFYDGYWIKAYDAPADTLLAKKRLIEALTRRLFNHTEHGINIPGTRLDEARRAFDSETDPRRKRVKGAMLAGALFNRATDIFTKLVEIQALGVEIQSDNALMRRCGEHLQEALGLGKLVLHRSGDEGIDELWGEPFKAFAFPIEEFYKSRYIKMALTMRAIDQIADELCLTFANFPEFAGVTELVREFARASKLKCETLRTDKDIFDVWTSFAVSGERLCAFAPQLPSDPNNDVMRRRLKKGLRLLHSGKELVCYIARARVPMPKSTHALIERCIRYRNEMDSPRRSRPSERPAARTLSR